MSVVSKKVYRDDMSERIGRNIDLFKFIFAYFVIAIHVRPFYYVENIWVGRLTEQLFSVAVPFFFMASGFLIASKLGTGASSGQVIKKHLIKVIKMYLLWSALYFPLALYGLVKEGYSIAHMIGAYIGQLLFAGEFHNAWHLWYLLSTIYAFVLLLVLAGKIDRYYYLTLGIVALVFCVLCTGISWVMSTDLLGPDNPVRMIIASTIKSNRVLLGFIYITVGMLLYKFSFSMKFAVPVFSGCFIIDMLAENSAASSVLSFIYFVMLFEIILGLKIKPLKTLVFRRMSINIYLIHMYVWVVLYMVMYRKQTFGVMMYVITALACTVVTYVIYLLQKRK